jgi:hypothetical protein
MISEESQFLTPLAGIHILYSTYLKNKKKLLNFN